MEGIEAVSYKLEGNMNSVDDSDNDSSSSESEQDSDCERRRSMSEEEDGSSDEEELEVFGEAPTTHYYKPKSRPKLHKQKPPSAVNADQIATSAAFDDSLDGIKIGFEDESGSKMTGAPTINFVVTSVINSDESRPILSSAHPPSASVSHEDASDDDEEFAWDGGATESTEAVATVLRNAAARANDIDTSVDFSAEIAAVEATKQSITTDFDDDFSQGVASSSDLEAPQFIASNTNTTVTSKQKLQEDARRALQDIVDVYGSGLGDQEVALLSESFVKDSKVSSYTAPPASSKALNSIAEDDEEEEEGDESPSIIAVSSSVRQAESIEITAVADEMDEFDLAMISAKGQETQEQKNEVKSAPVHYDEAVEYLQQQDLSAYFQKIVTYEAPAASSSAASSSFASSWMSSLGGVRSASSSSGNSSKLTIPNADEALKLPFLIAEVDYNPANSWHLAMLQTVYSALMETDADPLKGADERWERIGFQGRDPRTDINRSMKILSLLQMLHLVHNEPEVARTMFHLSGSNQMYKPTVTQKSGRQTDNSWPFFCVGIMFTREALQALRRGELVMICNKLQSVWAGLHAFHLACFLEFGKLLAKYPTEHHAVHLAKVRERCVKEPAKVLKHIQSLATGQETRRKIHQFAISVGAMSNSPGVLGGRMTDSAGDAQLSFTSLEQLSEGSKMGPSHGGGEGSEEVVLRGKAARFAAV